MWQGKFVESCSRNDHADRFKDQDSVSHGRLLEKELRNDGKFWGDCGSRMFRHNNTYTSALDIIDYLMGLGGTKPMILDIQRQMIDKGLNLDQTTAGQELQKEILEVKQVYEEQLIKTKEDMKAALKAGDQRMANKLTRMQEDYETKIKKSDADQVQLKADLKTSRRPKMRSTRR